MSQKIQINQDHYENIHKRRKYTLRFGCNFNDSIYFQIWIIYFNLFEFISIQPLNKAALMHIYPNNWLLFKEENKSYFFKKEFEIKPDNESIFVNL